MNKGYLTIGLTSTQIRYAYVAKEKGKHQLQKAGSVDFKLDVLAEGALSQAILEVIANEGIHPQKLFFTIAHKDTLIREAILPEVKNKELNEIIPSEIEKNPHFANQDFEFIFHKYKSQKDKQRIIFAALAERILQYLIKEIENIKIDCQHLEIAPLNLKDLISTKDSENETQILLVIHDQVSHVIIFHQEQYRLYYQMVTGIKNLFPQEKQGLNEQALLGLSGELRRVIKSYLAEYKEESISRVWLVWDNAQGQGLQQGLQEKLELDVKNLSVDQLDGQPIQYDEQDLEMDNSIFTLQLTPLVYHLKKQCEQFSFIHFLSKTFSRKHCKEVVAMSAVCLIIISSVFILLGAKFHQVKTRVLAQTTEVLSEIQRVEGESQQLFDQRQSYVRSRNRLLKQAAYVKEINSVSWSEVLAVVAQEIPDNLALTSFDLNQSGSTKFKGEALAIESVSEMIRQVDDSAILHNGQFDFLREDQIKGNKIFQFGISANLSKQEGATDDK